MLHKGRPAPIAGCDCALGVSDQKRKVTFHGAGRPGAPVLCALWTRRRSRVIYGGVSPALS